MTILSIFLCFFCWFFYAFLYDDIGRGQLNMQLNKSNDDDDEGRGGRGERQKEEWVVGGCYRP